ncbi:MAG: serpin family protein [Pseudomonadota bacterium]
MTLFPLLLLAACATGGPAVGAEPPAAPAGGPQAPAAPSTPLTPEEAVALREGDAAFALDLYRNLAARGPGNVFISPVSISLALAMTRAGARGETAAEMDRALHLDLPQERLNPAFGALQASLAAEGPWTLAIANRLWGQQGFGFEAPFLELTRVFYGAGIEGLDFGAPEAARQTINAWVSEHTAGHIPELIPEGLLDSSTTLVLTNAVWFKGTWKEPFDPAKTAPGPFTTAGGAQVEVPFMRQEAHARWGQTDDATLLVMPYTGDRLELLLALPHADDGLPALEAGLSPAALAAWEDALHPAKVAILLPRFTLSTDYELSEPLAALGMPLAFGGGADFSGITKATSLFISAVVHKAWIGVDEQGTEAAAATAVAMTRSAGPRPSFRADHPFMFLIRDTETGAILFMGRYCEPG